jgi:hypothetical protein
VNAQPADEPHDPAGEPAVSVLEEALRQALEALSREQVLSRVIAVTLPIEVDTGPDSGLHGRTEDRRRQHGRTQADRVQKVSVSMPAELTELVRARAGAGGFSRYVTEAVQERLRLDLLADLSAELEAEYGPVDEELVEQAMREWPDFAEE